MSFAVTRHPAPGPRPAMSDPIAEYLTARFAPEDALLLELREAADRAGLPPSSVSPLTGRLLQLLLRAAGATRALEVGTLGGCSAIWMARALPAGGRVVTIEREPAHAAFAREWIARAGLGALIEVRTGRALDLLPALDGERFDLVFLDADRAPLPRYLEWAIRLTRPGGFIVADNALAGGRALLDDADAGARAIRDFHRALAEDPRVDAIVLPVEDGIAVAVVR